MRGTTEKIVSRGPGVGEKQPRRLWKAIAASLVIAISLALTTGAVGAVPAVGAAPARLPVGYAGVDYYEPSNYFTHCADYTWLQASCYNSPTLGDTPRQQLISDLTFIRSRKIVKTMRLWISLDQLMLWNQQTGFAGYAPGALANLDDVLSIFHQYRVRAVLVLFSYASTPLINEFRPEALDGLHPAMRAGYIRAVRVFMRHLAANPIDRATAPLIELQNEPYYQLEEYFKDPARLGAYQGCAHVTVTDWGCVDTRIIHPWLKALYRAARSAAPHGFYYSFSDTGRMFEKYAYWSRMYPGDIINEHVYDSTPAIHRNLYSRGRFFRKPWIVTEAGCNVGAVSCTYDGTNAAVADNWWLRHLAKFGAQSVMLESSTTLWTYPDGPNSQTPTPAGTASIRAVVERLAPTLAGEPTSPPAPSPAHTTAAPVIFNGFDHLTAGKFAPLNPLGGGSGIAGGARIAVEHRLFNSFPNAVSVGVAGGGASYLARYPTWSQAGFRSRMDLRVGRRFSIGAGGYIVIGQMRMGNASIATAKIDVVLGAGRNLYLSYGTAGEPSSYLWTPTRILPGRWYRISVSERLGRLAVAVNGRTMAQAADAVPAASRLRFVALGLEYGSPAAQLTGRLYLDNVFLTS